MEILLHRGNDPPPDEHVADDESEDEDAEAKKQRLESVHCSDSTTNQHLRQYSSFFVDFRAKTSFRAIQIFKDKMLD